MLRVSHTSSLLFNGWCHLDIGSPYLPLIHHPFSGGEAKHSVYGFLLQEHYLVFFVLFTDAGVGCLRTQPIHNNYLTCLAVNPAKGFLVAGGLRNQVSLVHV